MGDWQSELIWLVAGAALTAIAGVIGALINWRASRHKILSDNAWADYELRRDVYANLARRVDCLFASGVVAERPEFHRVAREVRLIGSDQVVRALNAFTSSVSTGDGKAEERYSELFNAMRRDIRTLRALPPEGTSLDSSAFPIES